MTTVISEKRCGKCKETKPVCEFSKNCHRKDGLQHWCKACMTEDSRKRDHRKYSASRNRDRNQANTAMKNWRKKGVDLYDLTIDYLLERLKEEEVCECCGTKFRSNAQGTKGAPKPNSRSFDEVVYGEGHRQGNIGIICHRCNAVKNSKTPDELRALADQSSFWNKFVRYVEKYDNDNTGL